jgi:hypothetical protein
VLTSTDADLLNDTEGAATLALLATDTLGMAFWMSTLTGAAVLEIDTLGMALLMSTEWPADFETDTLAPADLDTSTDLDSETEGMAFWMSMLTGAAVLEIDTLGMDF